MGAQSIEVKGIEQEIRRLQLFSEDVQKGVRDEVRPHMRAVARGAGARVNRRRVTGETAAGYRVSMTKNAWKIRNATASGMILEFAAAPQSVQGQHLVATLNERFGKPGRLLWSEFDRQKPELDAAVKQAVARAEERANAGEVV